MPLESTPPSSRKMDQNGYVTIEHNPISRAGIFKYLGRSIGAPEPDKIYNVYRPVEEIEDPEAIESFKLIPLIDDHAMLGSEEDGLIPPEAKGIHGATGDIVTCENGVLYANLKIFSNFLLDMLKRGKRDLSLGYRCIYEKASGFYNGQPYDYIQRKLRGNHLALVDEARCAVSVLDHHIALDRFDLALDKEELNMAENDKEKKEVADRAAATDAAIARMGKVCDWAEKKMASDADEEKRKKDDKEAADKAARDSATVKPSVKPGESSGITDDESEEEKAKREKKEGEDKAARDAEEKERKEGMDAAIKTLTDKVEGIEKGFVKGMLKHVAERNALADQVSKHVGAFDHAEMTLAEVAKYAVDKLKLSCAVGTEIASLQGFLHNRDPLKTGFTVDGSETQGGGKLKKFIKASAAA